MTPQPKPLPDNSASATCHIIHQLAENKLMNGQHNAVSDAEGFVRGALEFIRREQGAEAEREFIRTLIGEFLNLKVVR